MQRADIVTALNYPFATPIHPDAVLIQRGSTTWADTMGLLPHASDRHRCDAALFGYLAARTAPFLAREAVQLLAQWCIFFFVHDDLSDESPLGGAAMSLALRHAQLLDILRGGLVPSSHSPIVRALSALHTQTHAQAADSAAYGRLTQHMAEYFAAGEWEATNRQTHQMPDVETYRAMRPFTGGLFTYIELVCMLGAIDTTFAVRSQGPAVRLAQHAIEVVSLANDALSVEREAAHGDMHNLVLILEQHMQLSRDAAIRTVIAHHNQLMRTFRRDTHLFLTASNSVERRRFITLLEALVRGSFDWTVQTARHTIPNARTVSA